MRFGVNEPIWKLGRGRLRLYVGLDDTLFSLIPRLELRLDAPWRSPDLKGLGPRWAVTAGHWRLWVSLVWW